MTVEPLRLPGTFLVTLKQIRDERGYFLTSYQQRWFEELGLVTSWVQENESLSLRKGLIRGMHFQRPPHAQAKLVRVVSGAVLDAWVDLREDSPTRGEWDSVELSPERNNKMVYIPEGFAHGFCTLCEGTVVQYKVNSYYAPESDGGVIWNDPDIGIRWPEQDPTLSAKDLLLPRLSELPPGLFPALAR